MFSVVITGRPITLLLAKQNGMGRTETQQSVLHCLEIFDAGLLVCVGIAGGLSADVCIGDVCYTGSIIDVLDNAKARDTEDAKQDLAMSPTNYASPREIGVAIALNRLTPEAKIIHQAWAKDRGEIAINLLPNRYKGKSGREERIAEPVVREGSIACGLVSGSAEYNRKLRAIDRKILAIETESGSLFSIAQQKQLPALTVRGISDYAGADKASFEEETKNAARIIAADNAASFLILQLGSPKMITYFDKLRLLRQNDESQLPFIAPKSDDEVFDTLLSQSDAFNSKLRDLAPGHALHTKGYRLPVPRVRISDIRMADPKAHDREPIEVRDALKDARIMTIRVPKEYPDLSLSWIIAEGLLSEQFGDRKIVPWVVEGSHLQRPRTGLAELIGQKVRQMSEVPVVQNVFIIDDFDFAARSRLAFLREEIEQWPDAKFVIVTRSRANIVLESEFTKNTSSCSTRLCDVSFMEIAYFLQKNFEMTASASEVVAVRLREIFHKYALSAHPSYFAGIPKSTLNALLQVNRRAELIEVAVAGYLSFVVSEDQEPIALSRTTREKFLAELALSIRAECRTFTELQLTTYAEEFAKRYDFKISPARFIALFFEKRIVHLEEGVVHFTLPFIESYLLAKRLVELPESAAGYFSLSQQPFDHRTFALYAEIGASPVVIENIRNGLDDSIKKLSVSNMNEGVLIDNKWVPNALKHRERLASLQKQLIKAEDDVRDDRDQSKAKQRLLDASDKIRDEAATQLLRAQKPEYEDGVKKVRSNEEEAVAAWSVAVALLGSGAERLEAGVKRELVAKCVKLAKMIINNVTVAYGKFDFGELKSKLTTHADIVRGLAKSESDVDLDEARKTIESIIDYVELKFIQQPFLAVTGYMCEEARDPVLAESLNQTSVVGSMETLIKMLWLSDINTELGRKGLIKAVKELPAVQFLRSTIAGHLIARSYWRHWKRKDRLSLLDAAHESLKGAGLSYNKTELKRMIEGEPEKDKFEI